MISEMLLKAWQAQCFSRSRHFGGREKVTKKVVGIRWKNLWIEGVVLELIFVILDAFWHPFWVPGASNLNGFFVKFIGKAPGSLLGAFWMPFGCLWDAFSSPGHPGEPF